MTKPIYPGGCRSHFNVSHYANIAMKAYCKAKKCYQIIKKADFRELDIQEEYEEMYDSIYITVIFSAMSIEAFLNDYIAACIGDKAFLDTYNKLSTIGKFDCCARFILKSKIDKSKSYYSYLKSLFSLRDELIHSKSKEMDLSGFDTSKEAAEAWLEMVSSGEIELEEPIYDEAKIKSDLMAARDSIKTLKAIAEYFDSYDSNIFAQGKLLGLAGVPYFYAKHQIEIFEELHIKYAIEGKT